MRHFTAAFLAIGFAVGSVSVALADCPGHSRQASTIASADQGTPVATPVVLPTPSTQSGS